MTDESVSAPKYIGTQWFIIGWLMIIVPIWTILNNIYSDDSIWNITIFSIIVVGVGGWVLYVGVELIGKYDIKQ